jgi:hypothetical protein
MVADGFGGKEKMNETMIGTGTETTNASFFLTYS